MKTVIFDWETTGLTLHPHAKMAKQPRVIEFGAVLVDSVGMVIEEHSIIIDPEEMIEAIITKITGLTNADLTGKPKFIEVLPQLRGLFQQAGLMVAHNLPFDQFLLELELTRAGVTDFPWPKQSLCTVQAYQEEWGRRPKLLELYERVTGRPLMQTHRALDDALALSEIVIKEGLIHDYLATA